MESAWAGYSCVITKVTEVLCYCNMLLFYIETDVLDALFKLKALKRLVYLQILYIFP